MIELQAGAVLRFRGGRRELKCVSGVLWVTSEGDSSRLAAVQQAGGVAEGGGLAAGVVRPFSVRAGWPWARASSSSTDC